MSKAQKSLGILAAAVAAPEPLSVAEHRGHLMTTAGPEVLPTHSETTGESILDGLAEHDLRSVKTFVKALQEHRGYITPAEEFVKEILEYMSTKRGLTPAIARDLVQEFESNFADVLEIHRYVTERYPKEVAVTP